MQSEHIVLQVVVEQIQEVLPKNQKLQISPLVMLHPKVTQ